MKWPKVALDTVCEINVGRTPSRKEKSYWDKADHQWVSIADMSRERHIKTTKEGFSEKARVECNMKPVLAGTVLFSFKLSIGKVSICTKDMFTNEAIAALPVLNPLKLDAGYLARALEDLSFEGAGRRAVMGKTLNKEGLRKIKIPLPPLPEQQRIATILDQADALRRLRRESISKLEEVAWSKFQAMFGDMRTNSMGWQTYKLGDLCDLVRGSSPRPQGDARYFGGPVPRLMIADISRDGMRVKPAIDSLTLEGAKRSRPMKAGSVVMAVSGAVGLPAIMEIDACIHDGFVGFKNLNSLISPEFLYCFLKVQRRGNSSKGTGAIWKNLTTSQVSDFDVPCPPLELQNRFIQHFQLVDEQLKDFALYGQTLDALFASLQHRAFRGEL